MEQKSQAMPWSDHRHGFNYSGFEGFCEKLAVCKVQQASKRLLAVLLGDETGIMLYNIESTYSFIMELGLPHYSC